MTIVSCFYDFVFLFKYQHLGSTQGLLGINVVSIWDKGQTRQEFRVKLEERLVNWLSICHHWPNGE